MYGKQLPLLCFDVPNLNPSYSLLPLNLASPPHPPPPAIFSVCSVFLLYSRQTLNKKFDDTLKRYVASVSDYVDKHKQIKIENGGKGGVDDGGGGGGVGGQGSPSPPGVQAGGGISNGQIASQVLLGVHW